MFSTTGEDPSEAFTYRGGGYVIDEKKGAWKWEGGGDEVPKDVTEVVIDPSVKEIGKGSFEECLSLTSACIPEGVEKIGDYAFTGCSSLNCIYLPEGVRRIGSCAFAECASLVSTHIPDGVWAIGDGAFCGCSSLTSVHIPEGVITIGDKAFKNCSSLTSINIPKGVVIGDYAFEGCSSLTSVYIPEKVVSSGWGTFDGCPRVMTIHIPEGVKTIGDYAFTDCSWFTSVHIPEGVETVGNGSFRGCSFLAFVHLPEGVKTISDDAFRNCSSLTSVKIPEGVKTIGHNVFNGCSSLTSVHIPEGVKTIGKGAFANCSFLTSVHISEGVETIGGAAFSHCSSLTSVHIPEGVETIGDYAFDSCSALTSIHLPKGVETIGEKAVRGCSSLTSVYLPMGVKTIGKGAFGNCSSLLSVHISEGIKTIGDSAFSGCLALTSVHIPEGCETIGEMAFKECSSLTSVHILKGGETIGESAFERCLFLTSVYISKGVKTIGYGAFGSCSSLTFVHIPEGCETIGYGAFCDCSSLTSVHIPEGVETIGPSAFEGCSSLTSVYISEGVKEIGYSAFRGCSSLASVHIPEGCETIQTAAFENCTLLEKACRDHRYMYTDVNDFLRHRFDDMPLHCICYRANISPDAIRNHPDLVMKTDVMGTTPLHLLASNPSVTKDMLYVILEQSHAVSACSQKATNGMCPLHFLALNPNLTMALLKVLIEADTSTAAVKDVNGRYPLHLLCRNSRATKETAGLLISTFPDAPQIIDDKFDFPLTVALRSGLCREVQEFLFSCNPIGITSVDDNNVETLRSIAASFLENLRSDPPKRSSEFSPSQQHGWTKFVSTTEILELSKELTETTVKFIKDERIDKAIIEILAYAKDIRGRPAIEIAIPEIKAALQERILFLGRYELAKGPPIHQSATSVVMKAYDQKAAEDYRGVFQDHAGGGKEISMRTFKAASLNLGIDSAALDDMFSKYDVHKGGRISEYDFVTACQNELDHGQRREVAFKFMSDPEQFQREIEFRSVHDLNPDFVLGLLDSYDGEEDEKFNSAMDALDQELKLGHYKYALLMPFADRNLDTIFRSERPSPSKVRAYAEQIGEAVRCLHEKGIIHGDLKLLNIVRYRGRLRLIDLDASAKISTDEVKSYVGAKFSSGVLPPEMIAPMSLEGDELSKFVEYFKCAMSDMSEEYITEFRQRAMKLNYSTGTGAYVVKTFRIDSMSKPCTDAKNELEALLSPEEIGKLCKARRSNQPPVYEPDQLPYDLVEATEVVDIWSFGTVLYTLSTGRPLFDVDRDDNISSFSSMRELSIWDDDHKNTKLEAVEDPFARLLLSKLLSKEPKERESMITALGDAFFHDDKRMNSETLSRLNELKEGQEMIRRSILEGQKSMQTVILRAMLSMSSATVPTLWILSRGERHGVLAAAKKRGPYEKYELRMLCQITGRCSHVAIKLYIPKDGVRTALTTAAPMVKFTLLLLKVGAVVGKLYGVPIPSELPFVEEACLKDVGNTAKYLDEWIKHFEVLEEAADKEDITGDKDKLLTTLCKWKERNENSGLETCEQLRSLLNAFGEDRPYEDAKIRKLAGLQKMVNVKDGSCIWVKDSKNAKKEANKEGYVIEAKIN